MLLYILLTVLFLLLVVWYRQPKKLTLPGPTGLPILGNLLQLDQKDPHGQLTEWSAKYGDIYGLNLFGVNWVVITGYDALHEVFVKRGPEFHDRPRGMYRISYASFGYNNLFWAQGDSHYYGVSKKLMHKVLKQYSAGMEKIERVVSTMLEDLVIKFKENKGESRNPMDDVYNFAIKSLLYFTIDRYIDEKDQLFQQFYHMERAFIKGLVMTGEGSEIDSFPFLKHFGNVAHNCLTEARNLVIQTWDNQLKKEIEEETQIEEDPNDPRGLMHAMVRLQRTERDEKGELLITDTNVRMYLAEVMSAGITTTSNTLGAFFNIVTHYPQVQSKIHEEVDRVLGRSTVLVKDREDMPYTRAVVYELNRYVSVVPLSLPHAASKDVMLAGSFIPKGTIVLANTWGLHHDESFWGDPWNFRPERFLDEEGHLVPADHENRKHLLPFGAGSRVCIGEIFAMTRLFLFIATMMQKFTVEPVPGEKVSCDPRTYVLGLTLAPQPFKVKFIPR